MEDTRRYIKKDIRKYVSKMHNVDKYKKVIYPKIKELIDSGAIDINELNDNAKLNDFILAVSTIVPIMLIKYISGEKVDVLEYNHFSNRLVVCFILEHHDPFGIGI